jgi:peptidoglycan hydrolase-like protein with peptidoglycan-binding domain
VPRPGRVFVWMALAVIVVVGAVEGFAATSVDTHSNVSKPNGATSSTTPSGVHGKPRGLHLRRESPTAGENNVPFGTTVELQFSLPLERGTPLPTITPLVAGSWSRPRPTTLVFHPAGSFVPLEQVTVVVPGGTTGIRSSSGATLASSVSASFTVEGAPVLRLQQLLAELGYLPVVFTPPAQSDSADTSTTYPSPVTTTGWASGVKSALADEPTQPDEIPLVPEPGSFQWRFPSTPQQLATLWVPGAWNVVTQGALMAFESDHGLYVDGVAGPSDWAALLRAVAAREVTTRPYTYLIATETLPETLYVWRGGQIVFQTPVNTGGYRAATPLGTWPVYLRFLSVTMKGTNPDGTKYDDPGVPWVSYFYESDAVHGFLRAGYGYPQSDGCVELPYQNAQTIYPLDTFGTLVTVTTGELWQELGTTAPVYASGYLPTTTTTTTTTTTIPIGVD